MALHYVVHHGFPHDGVWYTRENADAIKALPREVRDNQIALGHISEYDDRQKAAEPAAPARTGKDK